MACTSSAKAADTSFGPDASSGTSSGSSQLLSEVADVVGELARGLAVAQLAEGVEAPTPDALGVLGAGVESADRHAQGPRPLNISVGSDSPQASMGPLGSGGEIVHLRDSVVVPPSSPTPRGKRGGSWRARRAWSSTHGLDRNASHSVGARFARARSRPWDNSRWLVHSARVGRAVTGSRRPFTEATARYDLPILLLRLGFIGGGFRVQREHLLSARRRGGADGPACGLA